MRTRSSFIVAAHIFFCFAILTRTCEAGSAERGVTIADSIEMTKIGDPSYEYSDKPIASFSPDKKRFVIVTRRGNLTRNSNDYRLLLFETAAVFKTPQPEVLLTLSSALNEPAIQDVRWVDDSTLVFLGLKSDSRQVYSFSLRTRKLRQLTKHETDIISYAVNPDLGAVIYIAHPRPTKFFVNARQLNTGLVISDQNLTDLMVGHGSEFDNGLLYPYELFIQMKTSHVHKIDLAGGHPVEPVVLSPDGRYAVAKVLVTQYPASWNEYQEFRNAPQTFVAEYFLLDTRTRAVRPLLNAPLSAVLGNDIAWSSDGKSVVVSDTYLPLDIQETSERKLRESQVFAAEIEVETGKIDTISKGRYELRQWDWKTNSVFLKPFISPMMIHTAEEKQGTIIGFRKRGGGWARWDDAAGKVNPDSLEVVEKEGPDRPPFLMAMNSVKGRETMLMDLNPQFGKLRFGVVQEITWKGSDGHDAKGGLYLPPDYRAGQRYPLVIQTHGWEPEKFEIDGESTAGYAAQSLAAKGIIVAQLPLLRDGLATSDEGKIQVAMYEGLIDYLDQRGMIDRNKVGLLGWSRTGYHVRYALTFSKYHFAAAIIADGTDDGYFHYIGWLNVGQNRSTLYDHFNGGEPFGGGLHSWVEHATAFNLDKVHTPVRLLGFGRYGLVANWEWFAGLQHLGKPVELVWLPDAEHAPVKPLERMSVQGGSVDWFCFWLKGDEDKAPEKEAQYERWRKMRQGIQARLAD